ncbi:MAG: heavy metal sensor histidine kinase, partial [Thiohalomonadales bacterium]
MARPASLIIRLTLSFGTAAAIVFSGFGWFIERSVEQHFIAEDAAELEVIAQSVSQTLSLHSALKNYPELEQRFTDILVSHHDAILHVTDQDGLILFASHGDTNFSSFTKNIQIDTLRTNSVQLLSVANHTYRVLFRSLIGGNIANHPSTYSMLVAVAIDSHQRFLDHFRRTLWIMIVSGILVTGLMGWIAVRQGHAPLHNIIAHIERISASELNTRLSPASVPRELTKLAVSFNEMLARMEEAFMRLSNFSADIAHELRTPITSLLTQTQVALSQSRSTDEYQEILYSNIEEYEHMAQMIGDMLFLAKADNGLYHTDTVEIDLSKEVQALFEYYEGWADERGVALKLEGRSSLRGDRNLLRRALGNLLSNAIRHTPAGTTVQVQLDQASDQSTTICVENLGPTIPIEHITKLFDRFYRVDASRQRAGEGVGLGLAIAKSIVELHHGKIDVQSSNGLTQFRITIPT